MTKYLCCLIHEADSQASASTGIGCGRGLAEGLTERLCLTVLIHGTMGYVARMAVVVFLNVRLIAVLPGLLGARPVIGIWFGNSEFQSSIRTGSALCQLLDDSGCLVAGKKQQEDFERTIDRGANKQNNLYGSVLLTESLRLSIVFRPPSAR